MFGLKEKLGIKVFVILLFSVFVLAGLSVTQAYGQPIDSPIYSHTNTKAVESMNGSDANGSATEVMGGDTAWPCFTVNNCPVEAVPVMSAAGEIVFILTLTGGACWAILRKKRSKASEK
jgi:hypothetical protein